MNSEKTDSLKLRTREAGEGDFELSFGEIERFLLLILVGLCMGLALGRRVAFLRLKETRSIFCCFFFNVFNVFDLFLRDLSKKNNLKLCKERENRKKWLRKKTFVVSLLLCASSTKRRENQTETKRSHGHILFKQGMQSRAFIS